ncbi:MAG: hypothetical protein HC926_02090 [Synechococcaceae cyanobacterium SM2_3_60]|nr:hypothetical protein [Synechococcaceae cyanobacterium SM2_3_60]
MKPPQWIVCPSYVRVMYRQAIIYPAQVLERNPVEHDHTTFLLANRYLGQTHWQLSN